MDKTRKIELLAEILDVETDEIDENMALSEISEWDSLAILSFIVMMGEEFGKEVSGEEVKKLGTVKDVLNMMEK